MTFSLDIKPTAEDEIHVWHHYKGQEPLTREIVGPKENLILLFC